MSYYSHLSLSDKIIECSDRIESSMAVVDLIRDIPTPNSKRVMNLRVRRHARYSRLAEKLAQIYVQVRP